MTRSQNSVDGKFQKEIPSLQWHVRKGNDDPEELVDDSLTSQTGQDYKKGGVQVISYSVTSRERKL